MATERAFAIRKPRFAVATQQALAADRFAREIIAILARDFGPTSHLDLSGRRLKRERWVALWRTIDKQFVCDYNVYT